ncbi:MAG: hydrogenase maturation nickel metallochaperone HypA [Anaerolineales bacterium]|nr:hydrogenase maturation nickel metallochaperone HypA [Anaerolineales bacterium]
MAIQLPAIQSVLNHALRRANGGRIKGIHLVIGELVNMTDESIQLSWGHTAKGTLAEDAALYIRRGPAELQCMACLQKYHPDSAKFSCPRCGSVGAKVITGEEFSVEAVDLE